MSEKLQAELHHVAISVKDFDKVKNFYINTLGYDLLWDADNRGSEALSAVVGLANARMHIAMLKGYGMHIEIFHYYDPEGNPRTPARQCDFGQTHFALCVKDIKGIYSRLQTKGVTFVSPPQNIRVGAWAAYLLDPEGNTIELVEYESETSATSVR